MKNNVYMDLHTHSVLSRHAFSSLTENIEYAQSIGLKVLGCSEHQYDDLGVGSSEHIIGGLRRNVPANYKGMKVLKGMELNILEGYIDVSRYKISYLDYTIASMHPYAYSIKHSLQENTDNYIMACSKEYVTIIGHMDYPVYPCDYARVIKEASDKHKLIELNNSRIKPETFSPDSRNIDKDIILPLCIKYNVPVVVNSDAHIKYDIGSQDAAFELLTEIDFPIELVVNYNEDLLKQYIKYDI